MAQKKIKYKPSIKLEKDIGDDLLDMEFNFEIKEEKKEINKSDIIIVKKHGRKRRDSSTNNRGLF